MFLCYCTDIGKVRETNQDALHYIDDKELPIYIVADGMGGHKEGELASNIAVNKSKNYYLENRERILNGSMEIPLFLNNLFELANKSVLEASIELNCVKNMGTTLTMGMIKEKELYVGHIGDSRGYILRNKKLLQITHDHSFVGNLLASGAITEEEAFNHPKKNLITRSIGQDDKVVPDIYTETLEENDIFMLVTDGITSVLDRLTLENILNGVQEEKEICKTLVDEANRLGGPDNISIILSKTT